MSDPHQGEELLQEPLEFWEQRHASLDAWRVGGDRGLGIAENFEFYAVRFGRIVELIRRYAGVERPLEILDAGCGRGHVTEALRRCGHRAVGIDASPTAIELARKSYGDGFHQGELHELRPSRLFDVVVCFDVLFHVLDDVAWRRAIAAFGRYSTAESVVLVTDAFVEERYVKGNYIVHRTAEEYHAAFAEAGYTFEELSPYRFGHNPNAIAAYRRRI